MVFKKISIITLAMFSLFNFISCADDGDIDEFESESEVLTYEVRDTSDARYSVREELPNKTYDGYIIRTLIRYSAAPDWSGDMFSEAETGEVLDDAVYNRNLTVSERFDIGFKQIISSNSNSETDAIEPILAGDDAYDVIVPHGRAAFTYASRGLCLDWNNDLPYVDLDKPWWDQDAKNSFEINEKLYVMDGAISYQCMAQANCMVFNKAIFDDYGIEYPYNSVISGDWTFDEFARLSTECSQDLNGDGEYDPFSDLFGYATYQWTGPMQVLIAGGGRIADKDSDGELVLTLNNERTINIYEDFFKLLDKDSCYLELNRSDNKSVYRSYDLFSEGRAMFIDCTLDEIKHLRGMEDDFGIIPSPKYDLSQDKYYTNIDAGTNLFIVPITNSVVECTSVILEALCAEGYREVIPVYYEVVLQTKYVRDDISVRMLDIINDGRVFDIGYYYCGSDLNSIGQRLAISEDRNFSSFYASKESKVLAQLDIINEQYGFGEVTY